MNNWYNRIAGEAQPVSGATRFQNPIERYQFIMNAMTNPVAFIQEQFPDVPNHIRNNPVAILNYLQRTRGNAFTQQMQQVAGPQGGR